MLQNASATPGTWHCSFMLRECDVGGRSAASSFAKRRRHFSARFLLHQLTPIPSSALLLMPEACSPLSPRYYQEAWYCCRRAVDSSGRASAATKHVVCSGVSPTWSFHCTVAAILTHLQPGPAHRCSARPPLTAIVYLCFLCHFVTSHAYRADGPAAVPDQSALDRLFILAPDPVRFAPQSST